MKLNTGRVLAPIVGGAMLAMAGNTAADAQQMCAKCIPFIFNYGLGSTPGANPNVAGQLNFTDPGLVVQQFSGGLPLGAFTDTGAFLLDFYVKDPSGTEGGNLGSTSLLPGTDGDQKRVVLYYALQGVASLGGGGGIDINFTPGAGIIQLYSETNYTSSLTAGGNNIPTPDTGATPLAEFKLVSASSTLTDEGSGKFQAQQFGFNFEQTAGAANTFVDFLTGLNTFIGGVANALMTGTANVSTNTLAFHACGAGELGAVNVKTSSQPVAGENFNTNPGGTVLCAETSAQGNFELQTNVPEPGTLGLFGTGLLFLGFGARRRKAKLQASK